MKLITNQAKQELNKIKHPRHNIALGNFIASAIIDEENNCYCHFASSKYCNEIQDLKFIINNELKKAFAVNNVFITISKQDENKEQSPKQESNIKHIVLITSCKGGVGKSTISANLAYSLQKQGLKIGLLDGDIQGPSIPSLFNIKEEKIFSENGKMIPPTKDGIQIMSMGFLLKDHQSAFFKSSIVSKTLNQMIEKTAWNNLDILIIDMPPGTGDIYFNLAKNLKIDTALLVSTPQELSLLDTQRSLNVLNKLKINVLGLINNMAYLKCPCCDKQVEIFKSDKKAQILNQVEVLTNLELDQTTTSPIKKDIEKENNANYNQSEFEKLAKKIAEKLEL